jgi:beta-lactamase superfamily II metal-dependent hydrolase
VAGGTGSSFRANTTGDLRAYFLDVGQGDSSVILFKDKVILIDAGEVDQGGRVVSDLQNLGVTQIDLLVATHPHSDHIGGMQAVLTNFPVKKVLDSGLPSTSSLYEHFLETVDRKNIPYVVAEQGQTIDLDPSLRILVLSPPKERLDGDLNANSIILKISYGTISFLFTGDAGIGAEQALLRTGYSPEAQVLKVAHHSSSDATSVSFLSRVHPEVAVISLSEDNPYGYPHKETLDALQATVPSIYRTDRDGSILIQSDGASYSITTENGQGGIRGSSSLPSPTTSLVNTMSPVTYSSSPSAAITIPALPTLPSHVTIPTLPTIPSNITIPVPSVSIPSLQIGNASFVKIDAVQFNAPGDDRENLNGEWVRLKNRGDGAVLLVSWTMSDRNSVEPYRFPAFLLLPGSSVTVYTGSGEMNDTSLYMGRTEPLWGNSGDLATLRDGSGNIIDRRSEADSS